MGNTKSKQLTDRAPATASRSRFFIYQPDDPLRQVPATDEQAFVTLTLAARGQLLAGRKSGKEVR